MSPPAESSASQPRPIASEVLEAEARFRHSWETENPRRPRALDLMVAVASTPEIVVAACLGARPKKLGLLDTGFIDVVDSLRSWARSDARAPELTVVPCDEHNFLSSVDHLVRQEKRADRVCFLITPGTTEHAAWLAMLAQARGIPALHVPVEYERQADGRRRVLDGTQTLKLLEIPDPIQRHDALRAARSLAAARNFGGAVARLEALPVRRWLDQATQGWIETLALRDAFRFEEAAAKAETALRNLRAEPEASGHREERKRLELLLDQQVESCRVLSTPGEQAPWSLLAEALQRARAEELSERFGHAALLLYRVAEGAAAARLLVRWQLPASKGLDPGTWAHGTWSEFRERFDELGEKVHGRDRYRPLPEDGLPTLNLGSGLLTLAALGDEALGEVVKHGGPEVETFLRRIDEGSIRRNKLAFAHGFDSITPQQFEEWRDLVAPQDEERGLTGMLHAEPSRADWSAARKAVRESVLTDDGRGIRAPMDQP